MGRRGGAGRLVALGLAGWLVVPAAAPAERAPASADERVDLALGSFHDAERLRLLARPPVPWRGPRERHPFDQEPPGAQRDFRGIDPGAHRLP